ncbi:MAG TPA: pentapeptide repeat-containing protein [Pyrinomonadaceae bacterium]|nr:pentapeptide repeat-containing protein [Pyrinomonadaceae bacterium]
MTQASQCSFVLDRYPYNRPRLGRPATGCQFNEPSERLIDFEGKARCMYHAPRPAKDAWDAATHAIFDAGIATVLQKASLTQTLADLSGVVFPGPVTIGAEDRPIIHLPGVLFLKCTFSAKVTLANVVFDDLVMFDESEFSDSLHFFGVTFRSDAHFDAATFTRNTLWFATFERNAYFQGARFPGDFSCHAHFAGRAWFQQTDFQSYTRFDDSVFIGDADFSCWPITGSSEHLGFAYVSFANCKFNEHVSFANRVFRNHTDFSKTLFRVAPEFYGSVLHQDTNFNGARFRDTGRARRRVIFGVHPTDVDAARAYRTLKLAMEDVRNLDDEARFFALEQRALLWSRQASWSVKLVSIVYGLLGDYGRNIHRPLVLFLLSSYGAFLLYSHLLQTQCDDRVCRERMLRLTLTAMLQPFSLVERSDLTPAVLMVAFTQAMINVILLTLFVVAIRRRFRLAE